MQIQGLGSDVSSLSLGHSHGLAASRLGQSVMVWGTDDHGSLGQGEGNWQRVPLAVPQVMRWRGSVTMTLSTHT